MFTIQISFPIDEAIDSLRRAYKAISKGSIIYPADTFLRLPMFLQQAGRSQEAWDEFNKLMEQGYPNQMRTKELIPMDHHAIYDKMRLFLQREKRHKEAIKYGIFSHLCWCLGLHNQSRKKELRSSLSKETLKNVISPLVRKAKIQELEQALLNVVMSEVEKFPSIELAALGKAIDECIS